MQIRKLNSTEAPEPAGYSQAIEATGGQRIVFVSGQIPVTRENAVPEGFEAQCRLAWANVEAQLRAAGMTLDNLVKVTTYLSDREFGLRNRAVRREVLGDRRPASTVVVAGIFDSAWLLEIEAIAMA